MNKAILVSAVLAVIASFGDAQATTENYTLNSAPGLFSYDSFGKIAADSKLTFTYTLTDFTNLALAGEDANGHGMGYTFKSPHNSYTMDNGLVLASSSIVGSNGDYTEKVVFKNLSSKVADYFTFLSGIFGSHGAGTLKVSEVSAVPLPASLPMFGLGLALLAGMGIKRKNQSNA